MKIYQGAITLTEKKRGFHLITKDITNSLPWLHEIKKGVCHVFIQHTSASLCINENADITVRKDFEMFFSKTVPDNLDYMHNTEGSDDMPAHLKAALLGSSVMLPVSDGKFLLGIWQGIYLCEHRNSGGPRNIVVTAWGE